MTLHILTALICIFFDTLQGSEKRTLGLLLINNHHQADNALSVQHRIGKSKKDRLLELAAQRSMRLQLSLDRFADSLLLANGSIRLSYDQQTDMLQISRVPRNSELEKRDQLIGERYQDGILGGLIFNEDTSLELLEPDQAAFQLTRYPLLAHKHDPGFVGEKRLLLLALKNSRMRPVTIAKNHGSTVTSRMLKPEAIGTLCLALHLSESLAIQASHSHRRLVICLEGGKLMVARYNETGQLQGAHQIVKEYSQRTFKGFEITTERLVPLRQSPKKASLFCWCRGGASDDE